MLRNKEKSTLRNKEKTHCRINFEKACSGIKKKSHPGIKKKSTLRNKEKKGSLGLQVLLYYNYTNNWLHFCYNFSFRVHGTLTTITKSFDKKILIAFYDVN